MGMYTAAILDEIARNPGIRQIEIADKVDCDPDMVEGQIREELASGVIQKEMITGPNGRPQPSYRYDQAFQPELKPAPAVQPSPPVVTAKSKAEMGVEFIENAQFDVTDDDLRPVLGLTSKQYPGAWMSPALAEGKVHREGKFWRKGPAPTPQEPAQSKEEKPMSKTKQAEIYLAQHGSATVEKMREVLECGLRQHPNALLVNDIGTGRIVFADGKYRLGTVQERVAARDQKQMEKPVPALAAAKAPAPAIAQEAAPAPAPAKPTLEIPVLDTGRPRKYARTAKRFSCALWSDGALHIARDGKVTETLNLDEVRELQRYLSRALATLPA